VLKFKKVRVRNFTSVGDKPIEIQLDANPTTLVQGKNGSAKSSVFLDSLSFCLFNRAYRNIRKAQLINSINKRECETEVWFEIGAKQYYVKRTMKPEIFEIWEDGSLIKMEGSIRDYQEVLEKRILRMNHKSFCQIVTIGSATFVPFMQLGQGARREIIEDLLDLQVFSQMNRLLRSRTDNNRTEIADIKYEIEILEEKIRLQKEYIANLKKKAATDRQDILDRIEAAKAEINSYQLDIENNQHSIDELSAQIKDFDKIRRRKTQYDGVDGQLRERSKKLRNEIKFFHDNDHCPTCKQAIDQDFKCTSIETKEAKVLEVKKASEDVAQELQNIQQILTNFADIQKTISTHQGIINSKNGSIAGLNKYISEMQNELSAAGNLAFTETEYQGKLEKYYEDRNTLEERRATLLAQKATYDVASVLLKDGGIKSKIIKQFVPVINAAINKYLQILDLNVQFEIDENFKETIKSRFREDFSYESFSEGEKARINLAITFAWRHIAKMRNSSATNLLILDEVADGGVDSDGIDDLVKILNTMGDTHVFVISHRESMLDKFHACIKFQKIKNFSHIVED
jgi:DNA repair exonuclease SbcCD ATPase subunit